MSISRAKIFKMTIAVAVVALLLVGVYNCHSERSIIVIPSEVEESTSIMTIIKNIGELVGIVPEGVLRKQGAEMAETGEQSSWHLHGARTESSQSTARD